MYLFLYGDSFALYLENQQWLYSWLSISKKCDLGRALPFLKPWSSTLQPHSLVTGVCISFTIHKTTKKQCSQFVIVSTPNGSCCLWLFCNLSDCMMEVLKSLFLVQWWFLGHMGFTSHTDSMLSFKFIKPRIRKDKWSFWMHLCEGLLTVCFKPEPFTLRSFLHNPFYSQYNSSSMSGNWHLCTNFTHFDIFLLSRIFSMLATQCPIVLVFNENRLAVCFFCKQDHLQLKLPGETLPCGFWSHDNPAIKRCLTTQHLYLSCNHRLFCSYLFCSYHSCSHPSFSVSLNSTWSR